MLYRFHDYSLDAGRRELRRDDDLITIEPKVFQVLLHLLENRNRVIPKEELLEQCWPDTFVSESALTRCLTRLRKAVQGERTSQQVIKTLHRQGYRFVAEITANPVQTDSTLTTSNETCPTTAKPTIMIVDDEPWNVDILKKRLEDLGYKTTCANNGQEALEKVSIEAPDLILLDVMMPVMDGLTACRLLKENEDTQLIPIVIMTALGETGDRIRGIEAGADDFLTKPVNKQELVARIQTSLKLRHTMDRKIGELSRIKYHLAQIVTLITPPEEPTK